MPNAKWKSGNTSKLKLGKCTAKKAVYTGKKVGKTTLTAYNKYNTSQKYTITVYIMPSGKLNKKDFETYGWDEFADGTNLFDVEKWKKGNLLHARLVNSTELTTRTATVGDSLDRIRMLYGNSSLISFNKSKDRYYKRFLKDYKDWVNRNLKYYTDYKYGSKYRIRFYFNSSKKVVLICYFKNYQKF